MTVPNRSVYLAGPLAGVLLCLMPVLPSAAQMAHEHQHASGTVANIQLDEGRKWSTDVSLRSSMADIRYAFDVHHPAIHDGKETDEQYKALADRIEGQVNSIVANCKLPPAADANLHYIVADLLHGVNLMRGQDPARTRHDGAALVHGALLAYGKYFDDPGFDSGPSAEH